MSRALAAVTIVGVLAAAVVVLAAIGWPASEYLSNDFAGFWAGSRMLLDGADPYDRQAFLDLHARIGSHGPIGLPAITGYVYPLTTALLFAPFALLPVSIAAPLWLVTQLALGAVALVALARALYPVTLRRDLVVLAGLALSCQAVWLLVAGGNIGGFAFAIVAGAVALLLRGRYVVAGAVLGLLVLKPHPVALAVPLILIGLPPRASLRVMIGGAAVAGALLVASLVVRPGWIGEDLTRLSSVATYAGRQSTIFGLFGPDRAALAWVTVAAIALAFVAWLRTRPPLPFAIGAAIAVSVFCAPYGWSYDHTLLLVPVAVALALVSGAPPALRAVVLFVLALAFILLPWTTYALAFQRGDESWSAVVPLALVGVLALAARLGAGVLSTARASA